jgi:hypothetical protein
MPASSHGLPTSGTRDIRLPVLGLRILTLSTHGRCGLWPSKSDQPSTARAFNSSREPITSKSPVTSSTQIGRARPQNRFFEIIQSPMLRSQSSSRALPLIDSGRNVACSVTRMISSRQRMSMNHSSTSRKSSSVLHRQQCG